MSLISFSAIRSRSAAWLGLLAILLLFVAPVISKSLAQLRGTEEPMMHHHMSMDAGEMMAHHAMSPGEMPMPADHHPMSMMDDNACGYCVLLAHLPLLLTALLLLWSARQAAAPPARPRVTSLVARFIPRFFHPRAPPLPLYHPSCTAN